MTVIYFIIQYFVTKAELSITFLYHGYVVVAERKLWAIH